MFYHISRVRWSTHTKTGIEFRVSAALPASLFILRQHSQLRKKKCLWFLRYFNVEILRLVSLIMPKCVNSKSSSRDPLTPNWRMNGDNSGLVTRRVWANMSTFMSHQECVSLINGALIPPRLSILWCSIVRADSVLVMCPRRLKVQHLNLILNDFCTVGTQSKETEHTSRDALYIL